MLELISENFSSTNYCLLTFHSNVTQQKTGAAIVKRAVHCLSTISQSIAGLVLAQEFSQTIIVVGAGAKSNVYNVEIRVRF